MRKWSLFMIVFALLLGGCGIVLTLLLGGCGDGQSLFSIKGESITVPRGGTLLEIKTEIETYEIEWKAQGGLFDKNYGDSVVWIAPQESGTYQVQARMIGELFIDEVSISITVVDKPSLEISFMDLDEEESIAYIYFMNRDEKRRAIEDFAFYMFLWEEEGYQGRRLSYLGQDRFRGTPQKEEMPIPYSAYYTIKEWNLERAHETASILPWVYYIVFEDGTIWNLYARE